MTERRERLPFTADERRALLEELFAIGARLDAAAAEGPDAEADRARFAELRREYRERLPRLTLSRCPLTNAPYEHSFDPDGLDGPWWDYRSPNRPLEMLQGTVVAFTGAIRLGEPLERAPFLCRPGPGAPFVVPRILRHEHARAVIWSLPIGAHTAYAIVYFADPLQPDIEPFNDWGTDFYQFESDVDRMGWDQADEEASDYDFELEKYLASGQLLWIAPGDDTMTLRHGVEGCPYLDLEGSRLPQLLQDGEVWYDDLATAEAVEQITIPPVKAVLPADQVKPARAPRARDTTPPMREKAKEREERPALVVPSAPPAVRTTETPPAVAATETPPAVDALICTSCGSALKPTSKFCPSCGKPVAAAVPSGAAAASAANICRHCGKPRRPQAKFCASCGKA